MSRLLSPRRLAPTLLTLAALAGAERAFAQNLLANPSFESGLSGWTMVQGAPVVVSYGAIDAPNLAVAARIGGGNAHVRGGGGGAVLEQVVPLGAVPAGTNLRVGGYFGGSFEDEARLVVRFLDGAGAEVALHPLEPVTRIDRNSETVLMRRERLVAIPAGTASVAARIEFADLCCSGPWGAADALFVEPVTAPLVPPPLPSDTELLVNAGFEDGWAPGSPLTLVDVQGWEGVANGAVVVKPYSDSDPTVPDTIVSCLIGGGAPTTSCLPGGAGNLLSDAGGSGALRQRLDVRGNAAQFATGDVALRVGAFLGAPGGEDDTAQVDVRFLDAALTPIAPLPPVGPVTRPDRNGETVVLKREREFLVPSATAFIDVEVRFTDYCCGGPIALADNVSAALVTPTPPQPVLLNTNIVRNGSFETGSLPGSPLALTDPHGWSGVNTSAVAVSSYGGGSTVPTTGFAATNGLGGQVLGSVGGDAILRQEFDLSADQSLVDIGRYRLFTAAWLGGYLNEDDTAEVRLRFLNFAGVPVGGAGGLQTLGPVTAADRNGLTTLLERTGDFPIPTGTRRIELEVRFTDVCCGGPRGLADDVRVVVYDTLVGGPSKHPGTGEDLRLFSGVNAAPTSGPGEDCLDASAYDVLNLRVESPDGTFDFAPLVLAANVFPTGGPSPVVPAGLTGLALDPFQLVVLLDGFTCGGGFGCASVLPGGTQLNLGIPPGLAGNTVLLQAFALPVPASNPAANGVFAASDAHEIDIF